MRGDAGAQQLQGLGSVGGVDTSVQQRLLYRSGEVFRLAHSGQNAVQYDAAAAYRCVHSGNAFRPEEVGGVGRNTQPVAERNAHVFGRQRSSGFRRLAGELGEVVHLPARTLGKAAAEIPQQLREIVAFACLVVLWRVGRDYVQAAACPCERHVEDVHIVHQLHAALLLVIRGKEGVHGLVGEIHRPDAGGGIAQGSAGSVQPAPAFSCFVEAYFLRKREDEVGEFQPLGLVHGEHRDGVGVAGRTDAALVVFPRLQEPAQVVAVNFGPLAQSVHEGLDEQGFAAEDVGPGCLQLAEYVFAKIRKRVPAFGEGDSGIGGYVGIDAVVGILQAAQQAQHLADDEGGTYLEGVVRHHRHTLFHQFCRNAAAFLVVPYQHGDVAETGAGGTCSAHGFHYGRDFFALVAEAHLNMAWLVIIAADRLLGIRIEVLQAALRCGIPEEVVIEFHHLAAAAAVLLPGLNLGSGEGLLHPFGKQPPVGIAPAVDALLHVAHYQRTVAARLAFPQ